MSGAEHHDPGGRDAVLLALRDVSVPFGSDPGLSGITLSLHRGERFALVGTSGAGKSSLLAAIADPGPGVEGAVELEGADLRTSREARRRVVLLDQRPLLFPHLDVRRNVAFPLEVRGVRGDALRERVGEVLALVRMEGMAARMPASLSGGQAHRVALARALAAGPRLLLLDEPFTGLDPELRAALQETVVRAAAETGLTTVTVTHDVREAGRIADRIGVLERRRLVRVAPPAELFLDPGSASVAELLGWPNRVPVEIRDGRPFRGDVPLPRPEGADVPDGATLPDGTAVLVFPRDGGELVTPGEGDLDVRVERIEPSPDGATARWRVPVDPDRPATASPSGDDAVRGAVAVDALSPPRAGGLRGLRLRTARIRLYPSEPRVP